MTSKQKGWSIFAVVVVVLMIIGAATGTNSKPADYGRGLYGDTQQIVAACENYLGLSDPNYDNWAYSDVNDDAADGSDFKVVKVNDSNITYLGSCRVEMTPTKLLVSPGPYDTNGNPQ